MYPNLSNPGPSQTSITIAESSDEDDVLTDATEILSEDTTEILSYVAEENSREQYISIYTDLSNLMEIP
jgi:hypothetical protein